MRDERKEERNREEKIREEKRGEKELIPGGETMTYLHDVTMTTIK